MSGERRVGSGGYGILSSALEAACEERDGLERELAEAYEAIRKAANVLTSQSPLAPERAAEAVRLLLATLPEGAP